jgi:hypothetical protein
MALSVTGALFGHSHREVLSRIYNVKLVITGKDEEVLRKAMNRFYAVDSFQPVLIDQIYHWASRYILIEEV